MTLSPIQEVPLLEDIVTETTPVAVIDREPDQLQRKSGLGFENGYDDLDFLNFSLLHLPEQQRVCLVHHQHSPGTDVCVADYQEHVAVLIHETLIKLELKLQDLRWVHPQYESELKQRLASEIESD